MILVNLFNKDFKSVATVNFRVPQKRYDTNPPRIFQEIVSYTRRIKGNSKFTYYYSEEKKTSCLMIWFEKRYDALAVTVKFDGDMRDL